MTDATKTAWTIVGTLVGIAGTIAIAIWALDGSYNQRPEIAALSTNVDRIGTEMNQKIDGLSTEMNRKIDGLDVRLETANKAIRCFVFANQHRIALLEQSQIKTPSEKYRLTREIESLDKFLVNNCSFDN